MDVKPTRQRRKAQPRPDQGLGNQRKIKGHLNEAERTKYAIQLNASA